MVKDIHISIGLLFIHVSLRLCTHGAPIECAVVGMSWHKSTDHVCMGMKCHITKWLNSELRVTQAVSWQESRPVLFVIDVINLMISVIVKCGPQETMGFQAYLAWSSSHCFILLHCFPLTLLSGRTLNACTLSTKSGFFPTPSSSRATPPWTSKNGQVVSHDFVFRLIATQKLPGREILSSALHGFIQQLHGFPENMVNLSRRRNGTNRFGALLWI